MEELNPDDSRQPAVFGTAWPPLAGTFPVAVAACESLAVSFVRRGSSATGDHKNLVADG